MRDIPTSRWYAENPEHAALDRSMDREAIDEYEHDLSGTIALLYPSDKGDSNVHPL